MVRSIGRAVGAVVVGGGALWVRVPRLPPLTRERASATSAAIITNAAAIAPSASEKRKRLWNIESSQTCAKSPAGPNT